MHDKDKDIDDLRAAIAALEGQRATLGETLLALADATGARMNVAMAQLHLAAAAQAQGDLTAALRWHADNLLAYRAMGNRRFEAISLRFLAGLHLQRDELAQALQCCSLSQALHRDQAEPLEACLADAYLALCQARLGRPEDARSTLNRTLHRLGSDLAGCPASETLDLRWTCQQVLDRLADERSPAFLAALHADLHAHAAQITDAADRDRLIQAIPAFRAIVAAHGQQRAAG